MADQQKPEPLTSEQAEKIVAGVPGMSPSDFTCNAMQLQHLQRDVHL